MIDWNRVEQLREEIGVDDFLEVAGMFLEEADQTIDLLSARPAPGQIGSLLHFLKGSALNLGLADLARLCQDGERLVTTGDPARIDIVHLSAVYAASRAAFIDRFPRESAA
ncbi:MAG: Hpt domain-containing protein [Tabrizicola sp.]|uniref:Hpt domain-containing protein n=1 Tax=Tabrizicola sp. TaxID=2005166 RepID=UPI00273427D2|nr:Hpt domain-containing protein [Tabrizicola sp.]MDP3261610.1 Hpt domain-containing protein [Tabrizicola sp.]MDP3648320.1 Hpt domain-containing protein [Paracoccaceae bacterium]